ncbi:MAG: hypothetical protein RLZZ360_144 [Candidatus Parcubacteria bacterium]|jgi:cyclopropane-fatty-acyl-phospholipid synthase
MLNIFRELAKIGVKKSFHAIELPLQVTFSDQTIYKNIAAEKSNDIVQVYLKSAKAERWFVTMGGVGFAEAFHQQLVNISDDDFQRLIEFGREAFISAKPPLLVRIRQYFYERQVNNKNFDQAKENAVFHYNYPARFYELIQGKTYGYVEGYWQDGTETLDESMHNRFNYMCKKMFLKPGMKVAEVGSGWGYMTNLMARDYKVMVDTYGLVKNQNETLLEQAKEWGVSDSVNLLEEDHRALSKRKGLYDRYVSLGVFEHAGKDCQEAWIKSIADSLKIGGIGLLSVMTYSKEQYTDFITTKYIFPGGNIPSISKVIHLLEAHGLYVLDLENARYHYGLAALEWLKNFKNNWPEIQKLDPVRFNERFRRTWFLYLMGAGTAFMSPKSNLSVQQIVFSKGRSHNYPKTRNFLYNDN